METTEFMTTSTSKVLRMGILGCGALGLVHARRLSELPQVEVGAVSDPDKDAMQRVAAAIPSGAPVQTFSDYREMLANSALDAVCINSPNRWHVEQLLASLEQGCHVLCEKPLSMIPGEVKRVVEATTAANRVVAIAYQSRYRRDSRILRRALQSGKWGRVTSVDVFACEDWITPNVGTWRHDPARCPGGFFADANGHQLDLLFWLTGLEPDQVRATIETRGTPVPMVTWGEARLLESDIEGVQASRRSGVQENASSHLNTLTPEHLNTFSPVPFTFTFVGDAKHWREEISIQTEGADFVMHNTRLLWTDGSRELGEFTDPEMVEPEQNRADTPDGAFIAALRGGPPVTSPPQTVWPVLRFTLAALASAADGSSPRSTAIEGF
jgi:predicted dehydrogenase